MFIRFEKVHRKIGIDSIIDENGVYLGDIDELGLINCKCVDFDRTFEEDGYTFFFADKKQLEKILIK